MNKENLVVLKGSTQLEFKTDIIKPNVYYRCIDIGKKQYLVYGIVFSHKKFKELFEFAQDRVLRDFKDLGILNEDNTPVSKSLFTNQADIHTYGTGRKALKVWYFRNSCERIYGFYPMQGSKVENQKECYQMYLDIINGDVESLDNEDVKFGNCGIPLSYGSLRILNPILTT